MTVSISHVTACFKVTDQTRCEVSTTPPHITLICEIIPQSTDFNISVCQTKKVEIIVLTYSESVFCHKHCLLPNKLVMFYANNLCQINR